MGVKKLEASEEEEARLEMLIATKKWRKTQKIKRQTKSSGNCPK
jgi:hypothetical protein